MHADTADTRYASIRSVFVRILFLNLAVALAKIVFGQLSGSISILSDGFHSLTDGASNVVALVGLRLAQEASRRESSVRSSQIRNARRRPASRCFC